MKSSGKLPQRKMFAGYLEREYVVIESNLKATLGEVDSVSATADIWTANNKKLSGCNSSLDQQFRFGAQQGHRSM